MAIDGQNAYLLAMLLASVCYGLFVVLYAITLYVMIMRKSPRSRKSAAMLTVTSMLLVSTVHLAVSYIRTRIAVIDLQDDPESALDFITSPSSTSYLIQDALYGYQTLAADTFLIYRLYIVYERDKRILSAIGFLYLGYLATTIGAMIMEGTAEQNATVFQLKSWITTFFIFTLVLNLICTSAIALRLYNVERKVSRIKEYRTLTRTAMIIVESGAIYTVFLISILVTFVIGDVSLYIPFFMLPQIIGIMFSLIMIRIGLGIAVGDTSIVNSVSEISGAPGRRSNGRQEEFTTISNMFRITQVTEVEYDDGGDFAGSRTPKKLAGRDFHNLEYDQRRVASV